MDASFFADIAFAAQRVVDDCHLRVAELGSPDLVDEVFILGRFRRVYTNDQNKGWPYLSASDATVFRPVSDRYIARDHAPKPSERFFVKEGWILVSCSGTVGRTVLATKRMEQYFLTHDIARVVPGSSVPIGYLYAYLSSWVGQALITKDQYGSVIKHLEPHHIRAVPVPLLPKKKQEEIHDEIIRAYALRDEANDLLDEADEMLHRELKLPRFDESLVPYVSPPPREEDSLPIMPHPRAFTVQAGELAERFDASYHLPIARTAIKLLHKAKYRPVQLGKMADEIYMPPRFKRIYVPKEHGVPFLRPSHLPLLRPYDLGYLSKLSPVIGALTLKHGDVMVTTDGTVGRVAVVTPYNAGWAGSNNIARITYNRHEGGNGYIAAFLSSPYGFYQLTREIFGGVVDHIEVSHIEGVSIPAAPPGLQKEIGLLFAAAFEKKDEATEIEANAIKTVETALQS
jgi:type I restriction enzyme S subunit